MSNVKIAVYSILGVIVAGLLIVGLYLGGFALREDRQNRNSRVDEGTRNAQLGIQKAVRDQIKVIGNGNTTAAGRTYAVTAACDDISRLRGEFKADDIVQFELVEC